MTPALDLVVLDFDGTVCDSADVKTEAFRLLYLDEQGPDFADAVQRYHLANVGVSRFEKIRHVEEEMLGRPCPPARLAAVADRFGDLVMDAVIAAPLLPGVAVFLDDTSARMPIAVASATPTEELRAIVAAKGLTSSFVAVEGSPPTKGQIAAGYLARFGAHPGRSVMVGDQLSDLRAAREAGIPFVGVRRPGDPPLFPPGTKVVPDFTAMATALAEVVAGPVP